VHGLDRPCIFNNSLLKNIQMNTIFKLLLGLLGIILLILFYFLKTNMGHKKVESLLERYLSKNTNNKIIIKSLNLEQYPIISVTLEINNSSKVTFKGHIDNNSINMNYHLIGTSLDINNFHLKDTIDVSGTLKGEFNRLKVTGTGKVFDGNITYDFINLPNKIENLSLQIRDANSTKIAYFFEKKIPFYGLANIDATFRTLSIQEKKGQVKISMKRLLLPKVKMPFKLDSTILFNNINYNYNIKLFSEIGQITISKGHYNSSKKLFLADYHLHLNNLMHFREVFKHKFMGSLDTIGNISYNQKNQEIIIEGESQKFGGSIEYLYENSTLELTLKSVPLESILNALSYPIIFTSKIYGNLTYHFKEKIFIINADLKKTRFVKSKLTKMIRKKLSTDLLIGCYNKSIFYAGYQNHTFSSTLRLDNGDNYIYLTDTSINTKNKQLKSKFKMKMSGQTVEGHIYNTLENPKVNIDTQFIRLINQSLERWLKTNIQ